MSRDIEIKFKKNGKNKNFFSFNFFKKNRTKKQKDFHGKLINSENYKMKATLIDFSPFKFLNQTKEIERFEIMQKVFQFCLDNNIENIFCDNKLKIELLKISTNQNKKFSYIQNLQSLNSTINKKKNNHIFILSCEQNNIFDISFYLKRKNIKFTTLKDLVLENLDSTPQNSFVNIEKNIYPLHIPQIEFKNNLDMLLLDCPARNLSMMPNGLGYVHNALKKTNINYQTFDLDIITYHRYHIERIYDMGGTTIIPSGRTLPKDPWQAEHYDLWSEDDVIKYFMPIIKKTSDEIILKKPKILGLSLQQCNESFTKKLVKLVKKKLPNIVIVVGGFSCYNPNIGLSAFPDANYMCIGEADLTIADLVEKILKKTNPSNTPGVISIYDDKSKPFIGAPQESKLDKLEDPRYEWFGLNIYRNWDGYQLTPVIASRGCRWSRCTFCAERFYWRIRSPKKFVDELEYLVSEGCNLFMFNESDLNGDPEVVLQICDEIINRKLKVRLTAQLRIHKKSDKAFFLKLKKAGFVALRFGVDAFSENTLKLQKKGYTVKTLEQNLKDCWESGIYTEVNWVIGVPGETDQDCQEGVNLITKNKNYIGRIANINPLILGNGSVYWIDPESHNIRFHGEKNQILQKDKKMVPSDQWYSINPYIDSSIRKKRFENIIVQLIDNGFLLGPWAQKIYDQVKNNRDSARGVTNSIPEDIPGVSGNVSAQT